MSSAPTIPFAVFDNFLIQTYGVLLAGIFVGCMLLGILVLQVFLYYTRKTGDPLLMRGLPGFLMVMEFTHQVLLCVALYKILIVNFGNEGIAIIIIPELFIASFFQALCAVAAHLFYTYRIWKFRSEFWIVPCITIPLTLTQLGFTLANNVLTLIHSDIAYLQTITYTVYIVHSINVFLDLFFVIVMVYLLKHERQAFKGTQTMVHRLLVLVINTGLMTTFATALTIAFIKVQPDTFTYAFFNVLVSSLYGNSVMANLNSRDYIRGNDHVVVSGAELSSFGRNTTLNTREGHSTGFSNTATMSQVTATRKDEKNDSSDYLKSYKSSSDVNGAGHV